MQLDLPTHRDSNFWDAHHCQSVFTGGGLLGAHNLITLCYWCHREESRKQAKKHGRKRRREKRKERYGRSI